MCSMVCPGEPHRLAKELGVGVEKVDLAAAYLEQPPGIAIVAMRVEGAKADALIEARINSSGRDPNPFFARKELTIGGKTVTWVRVGPFDSALDVELLYAKDDVLYIVRPAPAAGEAPDPIVEEAFRALP
jgi:glycine cleavage system aminomethyltransferase T